MDTIFKKEIEDISTLYDLLGDGLESLDNKILQEYIPKCSKNGQVEEMRKGLKLLEKIKNHKLEFLKLRNSYSEIILYTNVFGDF